METIRNYLETMFLNLPNTPEVYKAKKELWQMMEDKYTELKQEGISENEAVGTVISEFGNLDELAEDLGISGFVQTDSDMPDNKTFPLENAKKYLADHAKHAYFTALGVLFCIVSVCAPIFFSAIADISANRNFLDTLGAAVMFLLIAIGVGLLVYSGTQIGKWNYLKKENYVTDFATTEYIQNELEHYKSTHALHLTIGIMICILSILPPMLLDTLNNELWEDWSGGFMIAMIALGVFFIVLCSMKLNSYNELLKLNKKDTVGGNYVPDQQEETYIHPAINTIMSVYWPTITCIYLIWSFLSFDWWITWIIWPIAAIIHSLIKSTLKK